MSLGEDLSVDVLFEANYVGILLLFHLEQVMEKRLVLELLLVTDVQISEDCEHELISTAPNDELRRSYVEMLDLKDA